MRTVLVRFDVDEAPRGPEHAVSDEDIADALRARLDEFYPSDDLMPHVPVDVRVAVLDPAAAVALLMAASVGIDGADEDTTGFDAATLDAAFDGLNALSPEREER